MSADPEKLILACFTCRFSCSGDRDPESSTTDCRRRAPPAVILVNNNGLGPNGGDIYSAEWPSVGLLDWCGEWEACP
jgi:hypothetical protein